MANDTTTKHFYFDTTVGAAVTGRLRIIGVFWVSNQGAGKDIAADDDFLLSDANGIPIISKRAEFAGDDLGVVPPIPLDVDGITVTTMDGGVCHVWLV